MVANAQGVSYAYHLLCIAIALASAFLIEKYADPWLSCHMHGTRNTALWTFMVLASVIGLYVFHASQFVRPSGDVEIFRDSVVSAANFNSFFENAKEGTSHFGVHNNPFLICLVPFIWIAGPKGWYAAQFLHSAVFAAWCAILAYFISNWFQRPHLFLLLTMLFFAATIKSHVRFSDNHFAALALALLIAGYFERNEKLAVLGVGLGLFFREYVAVTIALFLLLSPIRIRYQYKLAIVCLVWFAGTLVMTSLVFHNIQGGFLFPATVTAPETDFLVRLKGLLSTLSFDMGSKVAYVSAILLTTPVPAITVAGAIAISPDVVVALLTNNNAPYSFSFHYYVTTITITTLASAFWLSRHAFQYSRYILLWIYATLVHMFLILGVPKILSLL
jgi:hypothetical protein